MRFSSLLFALPLVSSVFAAPLSTPKSTEIEARHAQPDVILSAVTQLKATVSTCGTIAVGASAEVVIDVLTKVDLALQECGSVLGIDLSLGAGVNVGGGLGAGLGGFLGVGVKVDGVTKEVAQILAETIQIVNGLVANIDVKLRVHVVIAGLLGSIDNSLKCLLVGINVVLRGCLNLCFQICVQLGVKIDLILSGVIGLVKLNLKGVFGIIGGLLGSGPRPCNC